MLNVKNNLNHNNSQNLPKHIAIIMDGNGRWAKKKFLPRTAGHKAGANALKNLVTECDKIGLKHLTVYAFSTENWKRPEEEVNDLMNLLREYLQNFVNEADRNNIKVNVIGDISKLDIDLQNKILELTELTKNKTGLNLIIALNYGARDEIIRAVKKISNEVLEGKIKANDISENTFEKFLDTYNIPDPELLIRTSGEQRLSNFLNWQIAYTEFYFTDKLWPDFNIDDLLEAVEIFKTRNRRFGEI